MPGRSSSMPRPCPSRSCRSAVASAASTSTCRPPTWSRRSVRRLPRSPMPSADARGGPARRSFEGGLLVSTELPRLSIRVDARLGYLGATDLVIKGIARADRHHFVEADGSRVKRLLVVQFEGYLPSSTGAYRYPLADPVRLGG